MKKRKCLNLGPKIPIFGTFHQNCFISIFLARKLKKTIVRFEIFLFVKFLEKTKISKFGTENFWFMYFWAGIWKQYCHVWNQHPRICLTEKICKKTDIRKFGTKNAWLGYFWATILKKYYDIWNQHPWIWLIAKYFKIMKMPKFGTKKALFGCSWGRILKRYCHIWNQLFKLVQLQNFLKKKAA